MTKEEILQKHLGFSYYHKHEYLREDLLKAMEEYEKAKAGQVDAVVIGNYELLPSGYEILETDECLMDDAKTWVRVERWMIGMENSNVFNPIRRLKQ